MGNTNETLDNNENGNEFIADVSSSFFDEDGWNELKEDEGEGGECCGKNMVELMCTYTCLKCGNWEYSSS